MVQIPAIRERKTEQNASKDEQALSPMKIGEQLEVLAVIKAVSVVVTLIVAGPASKPCLLLGYCIILLLDFMAITTSQRV